NLVDADTGVQGSQPHRPLRCREVEDAQVADDASEVVVARRGRASPGSPVVADSADHVDLSYEGSRCMPGYPVARRMVHGVARRAPDPEQRRLRAEEVSDGGDVHVAMQIDLARAHHYVARPVVDEIENRPVRQPAFYYCRSPAHRPRALAEHRL